LFNPDGIVVKAEQSAKQKRKSVTKVL